MGATRRTVLRATLGAAAAALAGCTGSDGPAATGTATPTDAPTESTDTPTDTPTESPMTETTDGAAPTVRTRTHPEYGDVLTDADGMTLYLFENDTRRAGASTCDGGCADAWPPLTVDGTATASDAVTARVGTFERATGETQVTANGWPLYHFSSDQRPGDAAGQGVDDVWWVVAPDGTAVKQRQTTETATETGTDSGGGYY